MIVTLPTAALYDRRLRSMSGQFAALLQDFYRDLLDHSVPDSMSGLVRELEGKGPRPNTRRGRLAVVAERNAEARSLVAVLLEETGLEVVECDSAETALSILQRRGRDVAFLFADQHLAGRRDGFDLARTAAAKWPGIRVVVTTDEGHGTPKDLPSGVVTMAKPWRGLDVLIEAERALMKLAATCGGQARTSA